MLVFIKEIDTFVYKLMLLYYRLKSFSWHESVLQLVFIFPLGPCHHIMAYNDIFL